MGNSTPFCTSQQCMESRLTIKLVRLILTRLGLECTDFAPLQVDLTSSDGAIEMREGGHQGQAGPLHEWKHLHLERRANAWCCADVPIEGTHHQCTVDAMAATCLQTACRLATSGSMCSTGPATPPPPFSCTNSPGRVPMHASAGPSRLDAEAGS